MDATAAIIVLLFVIVIFSSGTGGGKSSSSPPPPPEISQEVQTIQAPDPTFPGAELSDPLPVIERYINLKAKKIDLETARRIAESIVKYAQQFNVNPRLLTALIERESRFNPMCVSSAGALGLGQLIPSTAETMGVKDPFDIDDNLAGTTRYFKALLDKWQGNPNQVSLAIASYLRGAGNIVRSGGDLDPQTLGYVNDILANYQAIQ